LPARRRPPAGLSRLAIAAPGAAQALLRVLTGDRLYAENAAPIIDAWPGALHGF
jgi:hypothetical protein